MMLFDAAPCQALTSLDLLLDANEYMATAEMGVRDSYTMAVHPEFEQYIKPSSRLERD
jgi:hypothetical protein